MEWYQEQSLSGLLENLADMQLFGIGEGVATGVNARDGLFRLAMHGLPTAESEDPTPAAAATGGVVFLDEIGDLPPSLQPKLLTVLTGADMYPVGLTGRESAVYRFEGLTIAATWKGLDNIRPDLVARLSDHRLEIPSLTDRREDIPELASLVLAELRRAPRETVERILEVPNESVDKERLKATLNAGEFRLTRNDIRVLQRAPWQDLGELRGMTQVIRRAMRGDITMRVALERHARAMAQQTPPSHPDPLYSRVLESRIAEGDTLTSAVGRVEGDMRAELVQTLKADRAKLERVARHLGRDPVEVRRRLSELPRLRDSQPPRRKT
jgi:DNA-binding NtrC family response regulator